eukprot:gene5347-5736_t
MFIISLFSVETCIIAAFQHWLRRASGDYRISTADGNVEVTIVFDHNGNRCNCGFPGYRLAESDIEELEIWCSDHPGGEYTFGFRGYDEKLPDSVSVIFMFENEIFNFHIYTL